MWQSPGVQSMHVWVCVCTCACQSYSIRICGLWLCVARPMRCTCLFVSDSTLGKAIFNLVKWVTLILNWQDGFQFAMALHRVSLCQLSPSAHFTKDRSVTKETKYMWGEVEKQRETRRKWEGYGESWVRYDKWNSLESRGGRAVLFDRGRTPHRKSWKCTRGETVWRRKKWECESR